MQARGSPSFLPEIVSASIRCNTLPAFLKRTLESVSRDGKPIIILHVLRGSF